MLSALSVAIQTLTRIPVPSPAARPDTRMIGRSALFYPLVGALLGILGWALHRLLILVLPQGLVALVLLAFWALFTGGLHEDGWADTFDAFGSQRSRDGVLRVLKDTRVGSYGIVALVFSIAFRWQSLALLTPAEIPLAVMASQVLPRAGMVALARAAGPATTGSGSLLAQSLRWGHVAGTVALALVLLIPVGWEAVLALAAVCALLVVLLRSYFRRRIGGITGDCLGAANQLQEIVILLLLARS